MTETSIFTEDIGESKYHTCEQLEQDHTIEGEQGPFPCGGYIVDFNPVTLNSDGFIALVNNNLDVLFNESARGLNLEVTLYSARSNFWVHIFILYEYGV